MSGAHRIDVRVESPISDSPRAQQLCGMFDVPRAESSIVSWQGDVDLDEHPWHVGLIVGPSGSGKSTLARTLFGDTAQLDWSALSVVDDFADTLNMDDIAGVCQAVGFNTIPAWLRPYDVLSTGEKFRVDLARRLIELDDPIVVDEFTSVVDRQVAQIGSHAVQKYVRRHDRRFVAVSCHYDVIEWLQPDWVFEPATMTLEWRSVQPRPQLDVTLARVSFDFWQLFAPFHYLTATLNRTARCFVLFVGDRPAAFAGVLRRPHPKSKNIMGISRVVTLPDWQGLGLAFVLIDRLGAVYGDVGERVRIYPAHSAFVRALDRSSSWAMTKRPGTFNASPIGRTSAMRSTSSDRTASWRQGSRPSAVFEYVGGAAGDVEQSRALLGRVE